MLRTEHDIKLLWRRFSRLTCTIEVRLRAATGHDPPAGAPINASLFDHCPQVIDAYLARGDEPIGHSHTNSQRQAAPLSRGTGVPVGHLRRALQHIAAARARGDVWLTTPGAIAAHGRDGKQGLCDTARALGRRPFWPRKKTHVPLGVEPGAALQFD